MGTQFREVFLLEFSTFIGISDSQINVVDLFGKFSKFFLFETFHGKTKNTYGIAIFYQINFYFRCNSKIIIVLD